MHLHVGLAPGPSVVKQADNLGKEFLTLHTSEWLEKAAYWSEARWGAVAGNCCFSSTCVDCQEFRHCLVDSWVTGHQGTDS